MLLFSLFVSIDRDNIYQREGLLEHQNLYVTATCHGAPPIHKALQWVQKGKQNEQDRSALTKLII